MNRFQGKPALLGRFFFILFSSLLLFPLTGFPGDRGEQGQPGSPSPEALTRLEALQEEIRTQGHSFLAGYSPAMEIPLEQLCGLMEPEGWQQRATFKTLQPLSALPSRFDWRERNGVTPVKNQRNCGSCWAFGTVGVMESQILIRLGLSEDIAEQYLVSCNQSGWSCGGGWWAHEYHRSLIPPGEPAAGAVLETGFPYVAANAPCSPPHSHPYRLFSWSYVGGGGVPSVEAIKQAIFSHGPVAAAVAVGPKFQAYRSGVFDADESATVGINHAIVLVGWDDQFSWNGNTYGVWILRNSWGSGWGVGGYMYIQYGTSQVGYAANYADLSPYTVSPPQGTIGTEVTVLGAGFGEGKPAVYLEDTDPEKNVTRMRKFKLLQWAPSAVLGAWTRKIAPGAFPLAVKPSSPAGLDPVSIGTFRVVGPSIQGVVPAQASAGETVAVNGAHFSTRRPGVTLQDPLTLKKHRCRVTGFSMDPATGTSMLQFVVPSVNPGSYRLLVRNRIGETESIFTVQ
jgi:hypothetical protein